MTSPGATTPAELLAEDGAREMSLGWALSWQAARDPDRPALTMAGRTLTRRELDGEANRLARALAGLGVEKDDRVAVALPTGPRHQITCFALWKLGATVIPLPHRIAAAELAQLIDVSDAKLVVGVDADRAGGRRAVPADFVPDPGLSDDPLPEVVASVWKGATSGGSTGLPKVIWDPRPSLVHPLQPMPVLQIGLEDVVLHPATAHHNSPFCQTAWALCWGLHVILMERFDALEWLRAVERYRVTWAYLVPTMMSRILNVAESTRAAADVSSLRVVIHMAAPCPPWVKQAWIDWLGADKIWEVYAGTEGYGATMVSGVEWVSHPGTVGRVSPDTQIRDDAGNVLPPGEIGTIWFLPPGAAGGAGDPMKTYGDMGRIDADGYLYLADRRTDLILTGGGNVYPAEIEAAIEQHPSVASVVVVGLPDDDLGAKAHAILELVPGRQEPSPPELLSFLEPLLSRQKVPYTYEVVTSQLRDDAGKVRRYALREERVVVPRDSYLTLR